MKFILASNSPRRQELLRLCGVTNFTVCPADVSEELSDNLSPEISVVLLSQRKAEAAARNASSEDVVLSADTLVFLDRIPLGKPADENDAYMMLKALSGRSHDVYTGYTLLFRGNKYSHSERTTVYFRDLEDYEIREYILSGEPMDKAGAYAVQGAGSVFVSRIEGDYYNVMGLPVCSLFMKLRSLGLERKF
ncbi:MAG: septum formation protein Maf [Clostridiales bacterium]|jgi:septum formation protein|nr:septum formation protein Maf [Clostridiales bacterium]